MAYYAQGNILLKVSASHQDILILWPIEGKTAKHYVCVAERRVKKIVKCNKK